MENDKNDLIIVECCGRKRCPKATIDLKRDKVTITDDHGGSITFDSIYQLRSLVLQLNSVLPFSDDT